MNRLLILAIYFPLLTNAQETTSIKWTNGLSWEQIKTKAKQENIYIFLDCFTTWCGPCKMMDMQVYVNDSVGDYFNRHFISAKVQMDKTPNDNEQIKSWYDDVAAIGKKYHIEGYPTYIFLSPQGNIVYKDIGYKGVKDFIAVAQTAIVPGKLYNDPYKEYDELVEEYKLGTTKYDSLPFMISMVTKLNDTALQRQLFHVHVEYVCSLPPEQRYTRENIRFWSSYSLGSKTRLFGFFYKDGDEIDKVMNKKGYAEAVIDHTIMDEIVMPFLQEQAAGSGIAVTGGYLTNISGQQLLKTNYSEADWNKLEEMIRHKFNGDYARRNVLSARIEWYKRHWNNAAYVKYYLQKLDKYPDSAKQDFPSKINEFAWDVFLHITNKPLIKGATRWMKKALLYDTSHIAHAWMDTYANLLYKAGRKKEAIQWEEKALNTSQGSLADSYRKVIEQMKKGEPTYDAVWGY